jgi:hypothetical protein
MQQQRPVIDLSALAPAEHWPVYKRVLETANERGIPYAFGGAIGVGVYTNRWRKTKDLDLYVTPEDGHRMVQVFCDCGLDDYYEKATYDRRWIYRGYADDCIVDAIWAMANMRARVDRRWVTRGPRFRTPDGISFHVLPPEELIWSKLYVMQRERCDWPDVLNIMYATARTLDWRHLIERVEDDLPLLRGVLTIFAWMCPAGLDSIPQDVRTKLELACEDDAARAIDHERVELLDTRPWFGPLAEAA